MALYKATLKTTIETLLTDMLSSDEDVKAIFADWLSTANDIFVKSRTVNVTVSTT